MLNVIVCAGFLFTGYSYVIPPVEHPTIALANFAFPGFAVGVFLFLFLWLFFSKKYSLISLFTLIVGYVPMQKYAPVTSPDEEPAEKPLKIISYNVHTFHDPLIEGADTGTIYKVIEYLHEIDADIICLQEAYLKPETREKLEPHFKYIDTYGKDDKGTAVTVLSKTPIKKCEPIAYDSDNNLSACFYVEYQGKTLRVINNHFESIHIKSEDRQDFKAYMKNAFEDEESMQGSKRIFSFIRDAAVKRQPQAEAVAKVIGDNAKNTIVVGDFNDPPLSYSHYLIDQKLTDCYAKRGLFTGFSYTNNAMYVRIDHAFCSDDFEVVKCYVDNTVDFSDHYPIITYLTRVEK